jgi:hypothetical protein
MTYGMTKFGFEAVLFAALIVAIAADCGIWYCVAFQASEEAFCRGSETNACSDVRLMRRASDFKLVRVAAKPAQVARHLDQLCADLAATGKAYCVRD